MEAAVTLPCAAWYVMGSRAVEQERREALAAAELEARRAAIRHAEGLSARLETIRSSESRRPFYEYRYRYPDLSQNCACAPIIDSPLARGPEDSILWTHFEIDRSTRISLPTIPDDSTLVAASNLQEPKRILALLNASRVELVRPAWKPHATATFPADAAAASAAPSTTESDDDPGQPMTYGDAVAHVAPFRWYTVDLGDEPSLVAMRTVRAPEGRLLQGFVVDREAVQAALTGEPFPARLRPTQNPGGGEIVAAVALPGTQWEVAVDVTRARSEAERLGSRVRADFLKVFFGGSAAAHLAAVFVVGLIAKTERLAKQRSQFAASAAHELRTPLAGLRLYGEMLAEGLGDPSEHRSYARQVAAEAERLARVVSNVLGYTRLERRTMAVSAVPGDLARAVREFSEQLRPTLEAAGAELRLEVPPELAIVRFDRDALCQILQNLIDNAERYSRGSPERWVRVALERSSTGVDLVVADRGPGIPAKRVRRLFRPFLQSAPDPDSPSGLGLGLALVGYLVKAQGASIRYNPDPGGGSVFRVTFQAGPGSVEPGLIDRPPRV
jgi:signal transduction histidine kinase